jgi:hypothetical protein
VGDAKQAFFVTSHQVEAQRGAHTDTWDLSLATPQISLHIHRHRKSVTTKEKNRAIWLLLYSRMLLTSSTNFAKKRNMHISCARKINSLLKEKKRKAVPSL